MKQFGSTCSVIKDKCSVISHTNTNWASVKPGSFISIAGESVFYQAARTSPIFYVKDFTCKNPEHIILKGDTGVNISKGDEVIVSFKEWELGTVLKITKGGENYKEGDEVSVGGGVPTRNVSDNTEETMVFFVREVGENGQIQQIGLKNKGKYTLPPNVLSEVTGGSGSGAEFELDFEVVGNRTKTDRIIRAIFKDGNETTLLLSSPLPYGVKMGEITIQKWELFLTGQYAGDTKTDVGYQIFSDFTPNLHLPLISKHSPAFELLVNKGFGILDGEIQKIRAQIEEFNQKCKS